MTAGICPVCARHADDSPYRLERRARRDPGAAEALRHRLRLAALREEFPDAEGGLTWLVAHELHPDQREGDSRAPEAAQDAP